MLDVIYEDADVAILNKPAGIPVHPASHIPKEETLITAILERWPNLKEVGEDPLRPGIVHRLDKETSGVLTVAKNKTAFGHLKAQFQSRLAVKRYEALVVGKMPANEGEIRLAIGRSKKFGKFTTKPASWRGGKIREAVTYWRKRKEYKDADGNVLTLLEVKPGTGRTHQIRVHLAAIGHPVVGDALYGGKAAKKYRDALGRHFLHASSLELALPSGGRLAVEAELTEELRDFLKGLTSER